jgi:transcriptional regulator with XRE-family HTH domain
MRSADSANRVELFAALLPSHRIGWLGSAWTTLRADESKALLPPRLRIVPRFHPVDIHVGIRLRQRRNLAGSSQSKLGESVRLTFQQIQKYESGASRISSSRLYEFAKVLNVPVSYFFDEMPSNALSGRPMSGRGREGFGEAGSPFRGEKDPLIRRETLELVRAYNQIEEERVRDSIFATVKALGEESHAKLLAGRRKR